jgi:hypothetical protein
MVTLDIKNINQEFIITLKNIYGNLKIKICQVKIKLTTNQSGIIIPT